MKVISRTIRAIYFGAKYWYSFESSIRQLNDILNSDENTVEHEE